jgi:serine phosphatase RsbU (regulator of sigma subunit)
MAAPYRIRRVWGYGPSTSFPDDYAAALSRHLDQPSEAGLHAAYDLGRRALSKGMTLIELVTIHHEARLNAFTDALAQLPDADAFLREGLGAYEIAERGYWDAHRAAALERERVDVLSRLTDAHLVVMRAAQLRDRLGAVCEQAMALVDGARARLEMGGSGWGRRAIVERGSAPNDVDGAVAVRVAIPARGGMGVLDIWPRRGTAFGDADRAVLGQFALLARGAIEDVSRIDREHAASVQLQRGLLPVVLPAVAGIEVAVRYLASERATEVGGDWYELIELHPNCVAMVVGDIMGHGLREASIMAQVRVAFHAYAIEDGPASQIVDRVDRLFSRLAPDHLATAVLCVLDLADRRVAVVNAGHPPPLRIDPDGRASLVEVGRSLPLGVRSDEQRDEGERLKVEPGTKLLLYTDGLTERFDRNGRDGDAALLAAVEGFSGTVEQLCDHVLDAMLPSGRSGDDTCLLAVEVTGGLVE